MRKVFAAMLPLVLLSSPVLAAKAVKILQPLAAGVAGKATVVGTTVTVGETAKPVADKLDAKAADKRAAAKLPPVDPAVVPEARPSPASYETLPLVTMFPLEIEDVARDWRLTSGRPVKLVITIDTLKTADAGVAMLLGSSDELAGTVGVLDAASGERLGEFYIDVLNFRAGLIGLAARGSGVREKLAAEFAKHIAEQLSGSKHKPRAKQP